jgi:hypothetical protein
LYAGDDGFRGVGVNVGSLGAGSERCSCITNGYEYEAGCGSGQVLGRGSCTLNESFLRLPLPASGIGPPRTPLITPLASISNGSSAIYKGSGDARGDVYVELEGDCDFADEGLLELPFREGFGRITTS